LHSAEKGKVGGGRKNYFLRNEAILRQRKGRRETRPRLTIQKDRVAEPPPPVSKSLNEHGHSCPSEPAKRTAGQDCPASSLKLESRLHTKLCGGRTFLSVRARQDNAGQECPTSSLRFASRLQPKIGVPPPTWPSGGRTFLSV